ncbi:putative disease resistance RPP13-like protein 1 [Cornus florida]|uniref:putative disease resistance RPP13-like protein 1 n=1 Tax=Cornus florida TaxID=4283 RepID=UPI00289F06A2|nr:putative disease resistance RPP13-like protein 1 [Cornus florida]
MDIAGIFLGPIIQVLLDKLMSPAVSNHARREGIDGQLTKLEKMLPDIRVVLADAEEKQMTNDPVKLWMEDLSDLVHDLDDLLDDFTGETLRRQLITTESQASTSTSSKVRKLLIPTCCKCFTPSVVIKLDHNMMSKVEEITIRLEDIETRKNSLDLIGNVGGIRSTTTVRERRETTSLVNESDVYGRVQDKEGIVEELLGDKVSVDRVSVIPIVGMGGIGKSTLAQMVYNDIHLEGHFDLKAWVCVSDDCHEYVLRVTKAILVEVTLKTHDSMSLNMLQQKLKENLSGKKFLLVLDDVWNKKYEDWELLKRPFMVGAPGSKIIVTTRDEIVASTMTLSPAYPLKGLLEDECLSLFAHHALERENFDAHLDLKGIGEEIVNKCSGLPLAVKTLAGLLRTKRRQSEWVDILNSKIWDLSEESDILPALRLSYHHLPSHLKQCFAYCAIFPKDCEFDIDELILLWMEVGLLQLSKEKNRMEDFGYKCFDDLLLRSFFQQSGGSKSRFVMHDLLNDLALHVAGDLCFRLDKLEGDEKFEIPK